MVHENATEADLLPARKIGIVRVMIGNLLPETNSLNWWGYLKTCYIRFPVIFPRCFPFFIYILLDTSIVLVILIERIECLLIFYRAFAIIEKS